MERVVSNTRRQDFLNSVPNELVFVGDQVSFTNLPKSEPVQNINHQKVIELESYIDAQRKRNERNKRIYDLKSTVRRLEEELRKRENQERQE